MTEINTDGLDGRLQSWAESVLPPIGERLMVELDLGNSHEKGLALGRGQMAAFAQGFRYGMVELAALLEQEGIHVNLFGATPDEED